MPSEAPPGMIQVIPMSAIYWECLFAYTWFHLFFNLMMTWPFPMPALLSSYKVMQAYPHWIPKRWSILWVEWVPILFLISLIRASHNIDAFNSPWLVSYQTLGVKENILRQVSHSATSSDWFGLKLGIYMEINAITYYTCSCWNSQACGRNVSLISILLVINLCF